MKQKAPLYGYEGQPPTYTLDDGRELSAGDLVEAAVARYAEANSGLDVSQIPLAWNNLEDARRRDWCESTLERMNADAQGAAAAQDQVDLATTVAPSAEKQLGAALIDAALSEVKALKRPWQEMTEDQQDDVLDRITKQVKAAVRETIRLLAARGVHHVVAELEQITVKKGAKAVLVLPKGSMDQDLLDAVGQQVILVVGSELKAADEIEKPKPDPDQPDLLAQAAIGPGVGGNGGPDGSLDDGLVQHSDPND